MRLLKKRYLNFFLRLWVSFLNLSFLVRNELLIKKNFFISLLVLFFISFNSIVITNAAPSTSGTVMPFFTLSYNLFVSGYSYTDSTYAYYVPGSAITYNASPVTSNSPLVSSYANIYSYPSWGGSSGMFWSGANFGGDHSTTFIAPSTPGPYSIGSISAEYYDGGNLAYGYPPAIDIMVTPATPTMNAVSCNSAGTQATLSWSSVSGAQDYPVRVDNAAGSCNGTVTGPAPYSCLGGAEYVNDSLTGTSVTVNINPNTTYSWWVHGHHATYGWSPSTPAHFLSGLVVDILGGLLIIIGITLFFIGYIRYKKMLRSISEIKRI